MYIYLRFSARFSLASRHYQYAISTLFHMNSIFHFLAKILFSLSSDPVKPCVFLPSCTVLLGVI